MALHTVIPYSCVYIDAEFKEIVDAARRCCFRSELPETRAWITGEICQLFTTPTNTNHVLPCLSVRTGFDLFCQASQFAHGSEIIMSAINIPSMALIAKQHALVVVPWDIDEKTLAPKHHLLTHLITSRTVAVVVAHIYGTVLDVSELIATCHQHRLLFVEDCAESFGGFHYLGHRQSDVSLFSFGVIKFRTAFGGAVAKVRDDDLYRRMVQLQECFPVQSDAVYFRKLVKYAGVYLLLNSPRLAASCMTIGKLLSWDYQATVVDYLRNFKGNAINSLRCRPSVTLLTTMHRRLSAVTEVEFELTRTKARYVVERLAGHVTVAGLGARERNFWLFPVIVDDAKQFCSTLNRMGVDAYRGATQLDVIIPKNHTHHPCTTVTPAESPNPTEQVKEEGRTTLTSSSKYFVCPEADPIDLSSDRVIEFGNSHSRRPWKMCCHHFPSEAKYIIDHVVYLPVHKNVPYECLDQICECVKIASRECMNIGSPSSQRWLSSKL